MKKFILLLIACFSVLLTGCDSGSNTGTGEISDTGAETAEITASVQESEAEKAISAISVDYMKETLRADWDENINVVSLYAADLNGDGVDELFVSCLLGVGEHGLTYVYDVSEESNLLCDMGLRMYFSGGGLYKDEEDKTHFISREDYSGFTYEMDIVYYDIAYDDSGAELKIPFCAEMYDWFDGGAHIFEYKIYTDCGYFSPAVDFRNFDVSVGTYEGIFDDISVIRVVKNIDNGVYDDSYEVSGLIKESVFDGLTHVSDIELFFHQEGRTEEGKLKNLIFYEFWESASPVLAEYYADQL